MPMSNDLILIFRSIGFSNECLGQHSGSLQQANLGDGNGLGQSLLYIYYLVLSLTYLGAISCIVQTVNETSEIRWNYGDAQLGACKETVEGGLHFRYWMQNGPQGNRCVFGLFCQCTGNEKFLVTSGAIIMAASDELPLTSEFAG